jgi:serine/threonine protein phosphatase 1
MTGLTDRLVGALSRAVKRAPALPDGVVVHAVGDVHGCSGLLDQVFGQIDRDRATLGAKCFIEVYLGDYVDRGPDTRGVIERLIARRETRDVKLLRGNHEAVMQAVWRGTDRLELWEQYGGIETMGSYGVAPRLPATLPNLMVMRRAWKAVFPAGHRRFLEGLQNSYSIGGYFFAHAGIRPGVALERQSEADLLWIRGEFLNSPADHGKVVVHGHTPVAEPELRANRINIDTGAFITGRLTCLRLNGASREIIGARR